MIYKQIGERQGRRDRRQLNNTLQIVRLPEDKDNIQHPWWSEVKTGGMPRASVQEWWGLDHFPSTNVSVLYK